MMSRSEIDQLRPGALLLQSQSGRLMVVTANNPEEVEVIQLGCSYAHLPPTLRPHTVQYPIPKPLRKQWQVTRIA